MRGITRALGATPSPPRTAARGVRFASAAASSLRPTTSLALRTPGAFTGVRAQTAHAAHGRVARAAAAPSTRGLATHAPERRVLLNEGGELLALGPGYVEYAGPAPEADVSVLKSGVSGVISLARLRDSCPCPRCIHPSTRQKTHTGGEALADITSLGNEVLSERVAHLAEQDGEKGLVVHWPQGEGGESHAQPHAGFYPLSLLRRLSSGRVRGSTYINNTLRRKLWDRDTLLAEAKDLRIKFSDLNAAKQGEPFQIQPEVFLRLLEQLQLYGLAVLEGVPNVKTDNEECSMREFAENIGLLRNTFYGETWDVKSVVNSKNVAYTNLNLGLHMDLLYMVCPPRFQLLHCLRNRVIGGASYFVDSFAAAQHFKSEHPQLYANLQRNWLEYEYDNDGHYVSYVHPILPLKPLDAPDIHVAVNWSPPFQAPGVRRIVDGSGASPADAPSAARAETEFYTALQRFQEALDQPQFRYEFTMNEGDLVLFDNQRVLHARTAFRDKTDDELKRDKTQIVPGEPTRWLKGCYLDGSAVWDKLATLNDQVNGVKK